MTITQYPNTRETAVHSVADNTSQHTLNGGFATLPIVW